MPADLPCHRCGYDLRAHPRDGKCPECEASVEESIRLAAIPRRPAWRDSDPRWRRRLIAGAWVLVLLPLMELFEAFDWTASVPVPTVIDYRGGVRSLADTLICNYGVYQPLIFCIGVVLLFSKERGRQRDRFDWTRRWGVLCSYVTLLLSVTPVLFISALVLAGVGALFMSMPLQFQPPTTRLFAIASSAYLRYGPHPMTGAALTQIAFASIVILLACFPLFDALRSTGPKRAAAILLAPLALFSLLYLVQDGWYFVGAATRTGPDVSRFEMYFYPGLMLRRVAGIRTSVNAAGSDLEVFAELMKWCIVLTVAIWLSAAQIAAARARRRVRSAS